MTSRAVFRRTLCCLTMLELAGFCFPVRLPAQEWAQKMFDTQNHNFGTVATGAECWHRIKITNLYKDRVHIQGVRTSCSCAMVKPPEKDMLASRESTYLEVGMDTQRHMRQKDSNVIVTIDAPQYAEVRIPVSVYIRTDVVLNPGAVNFGAVDEGAGAERKVEIAYAGRLDWKINKVVTNNNHIKARIAETGRVPTVPGEGRVSYDLFVTLEPTTPAGNLREPIYLITDDQNGPQVPVQVQARVESDITVIPLTQTLGTMEPGGEKTVNFVLRGRKPFAIENIEADSDRKNCKVVKPSETKVLHTLPITITAPKDPGDFKEQFTVTIEGHPQPITFSVKGTTAVRAATTTN